MEIELFEIEELKQIFDEEFKEFIKEGIEEVIEEKQIVKIQNWLKEQTIKDSLIAVFFIADFQLDRVTNGEIYLNVTHREIIIKLITWTDEDRGYYEEAIGRVIL